MKVSDLILWSVQDVYSKLPGCKSMYIYIEGRLAQLVRAPR